MMLRRNFQKKTSQAEIDTSPADQNGAPIEHAVSKNPFKKSSAKNTQIKQGSAIKKEKNKRPFILTVTVSEDSIDAFNQSLQSLQADQPLSLVVFPTPGLKPETLKGQLSAPEHFTTSIVEKATSISAQHIYLIQPAKYVAIENEKLTLIEQPDRTISPVETFLTSVAPVEKSRSIVLLFTPWIAPYLEGLKLVRQENGLVLHLNYSAHASVEVEASVISLLIDGSVTAREMAERVNAYTDSTNESLSSGLSLQQEDIQSLENIYVALHKSTGIKCSDFDLIFILQHIQQRLNVHGKPSITAYAEYINDNYQEIWLLARRLSLNVTGFFYERSTMQMIAQDIIPELLENKNTEVIRSWVPACSTGEEALSLAILLNDFATNLPQAPKMQVIGTEIDDKILQSGRRAQYIQNSLHAIPQGFRDTYFEPHHDRFLFSRQLLQNVHFAKHELSSTSPYANLNLIYYRGHLNKLKKEVQHKVLKNLHAALDPNGYLVIGKDDHIGSDVTCFAPVDRQGIVYKPVKKQKKAAQSHHKVSLFRKQDLQTGIATESVKTTATTQVGQLHRDLLLQIQNPVSLIVKADFSIIDQCGNVGLFIAWPNNGKTANLLSAFPEEVQQDLKDAVQQAISIQKALKSKAITPEKKGILKSFLLHVRPLDLPGTSEPLVQVMFIEPDKAIEGPGLSTTLKGQPLNTIVNKLEADLRHSKDRLHTLTRQLQESRAKNEKQGKAQSVQKESAQKEPAQNESDQREPTPAEPFQVHPEPNEQLQPKVVNKLKQQNGELKTTNKELLALNRDLVRRIEELRKRTHQVEAAQIAVAEEAAEQVAKTSIAFSPVDGAVSSLLSQQILKISTNRHEIRTALTSIMGFADLLADRMVDADNKELARYISKAGNRLSDSLADLLEGDFEEFEVFDQPQKEEPAIEESSLSDRLLVVEDSDATRRLLSLVLSDRFECELAADATEAIEKAQKERFKAVLMDINLGTGQSGVDVLQQLRETTRYQRVPFMAVTAMASPRDESLLRRKGFNAYLAKPFQKSKLLSTLDQMLAENTAV
ncbi:MAG: CheR family methyltransferase [Rhodothermales bacterium]